MSARLEALERDRKALVEQCALQRLELGRDVGSVRECLQWKRAVIVAARAPIARRIALGLAFSVFGLQRSARIVAIAARVILAAKVAGFVIRALRSRGNVRQRTDAARELP